MNLIQIQDKLRAMPVQVLQQYANGANPEIPPYVALGVLQEKQEMAKRQSNQQGAAQGEMPTIKDKVQQSAGLMGLQQQKQQQAAQQSAMANARKPGPVPGGVQPAAPQRTSADAVPMRSGGLARLRSNLNFKGGGIIGFNEGGSTSLRQLTEEILRRNPGMSVDEARKRAYNQMQRYDDEGKFVPKMQRNEYNTYADQPNVLRSIADLMKSRSENLPKTPQEQQEAYRRGIRTSFAPTTTSGVPMTPPQVAAAGRQRSEIANMMEQDTMLDADEAIAGARAAQEEAMASPQSWSEPAAPSLPQPKTMQRAPAAAPPAPRPQSQGIVGGLPQQPQQPVGPQASIDAMREMQKAFGYGSSKYDPQIQEKLAQMEADYEDQKRQRAIEDRMRVRSGSAAGYGGKAAAYLANQQRNRTADAAERQRQLQAIQGLRTDEQGIAKDLMTGARSLEDRAMTGRAQMDSTRMQGEYGLKEAAMRGNAAIQAARISAAARESTDDSKQLERADKAFAKDPTAVSIRKQLESGYLAPEEVERLQRELNNIQLKYYKRYNIDLSNDVLDEQSSSPIPQGVKVTRIGD